MPIAVKSSPHGSHHAFPVPVGRSDERNLFQKRARRLMPPLIEALAPTGSHRTRELVAIEERVAGLLLAAAELRSIDLIRRHQTPREERGAHADRVYLLPHRTPPLIQAVPVRELVDATGLSTSARKKIWQGSLTPHPRHLSGSSMRRRVCVPDRRRQGL